MVMLETEDAEEECEVEDEEREEEREDELGGMGVPMHWQELLQVCPGAQGLICTMMKFAPASAMLVRAMAKSSLPS